MSQYTLRLRPLNPVKDAPALHAIFGDEQCCTYLPDPANTDLIQTEEKLVRWTKGTEDSSWAITLAGEDTAIGRISFFPHREGLWEAAVMVVPAWHGKGVAKRAMLMALDAFVSAKQPRRIVADIDPDNEPSLRLFASLGFSKEGYLRAEWETHIGIRDTVLMAWVRGDPMPWA